MNYIKSTAIAAAASLIFTLCPTAAAAVTAPASGNTPPAAGGPRVPGHFHGKKGGSMQQLSKLTGKSVEELTAKYPQQTAWQIAYKLGKLDALKKAVLTEHKTMLEKMTKDGMITADDQTKMLADLQKRLAAIDGKNIVILGRPGYLPKIKERAHSAS